MSQEQPSQPEAAPQSASEESILYSVEKRVGTITLNRPDKMNSLRFSEFELINKYLNEADLDPKVHCIRIKSSGERVFCAGLDLNMVSSLKTDDIKTLIKHGNQSVRQFIRTKKPIVMQIQGPAVGWGCIASMAADFIFVGDNPRTFFQLPEFDVGIYPATGALTMALMNFPLKIAKKMLFMSYKVSLDEMERLGLLSGRAPLDKLEEECFKFCRDMAKRSPAIAYLTKAVMNNIYMGNLEDCFRLEAEATEMTKFSEETPWHEFVKKIWSKTPEFEP